MASSPYPDTPSPFSGSPATVRLQVSVGTALAEVFLIDHKFQLIDRSIGDLDALVEPGVYMVRARLGDQVTERPVVLLADHSLDLSGELRIASPAPLKGTLKTHEFQSDLAASGSGTKWKEHSPRGALRAGSGAEIFLMARQWSGMEPPKVAQPAASGTVPELSLLQFDGRPILNLADGGKGQRRGFDPFLGRRVVVDPGAYILRWRAGDVLAEQSVQAVRGWQTQVFLLDDASGGSKRRQISILMTRPGEFRPDDQTLLRVEEARLALAEERKVASERVDQWLFSKVENPMLGLFGAHLMLLSRDALRRDAERQSRATKGKRITAPVRFDQDHFDHLVDNLCKLLGTDHPDVVALSTRTTRRLPDATAPVITPPMLWQSWPLLIEASNDRPELVPVATWRRVIRLLPLRPFLVWSPEQRDASDETWKREVGIVLAASTPPRPSADDVFGAGLAARAVDLSPTRDETRRSLSLQILAPRAAIDELAATPQPTRKETR